MVRISPEPIDPAKMYDLISANSAGSVVLHYAVVKPQELVGGTTCHIDYGTRGDAEAELRVIAAELADKYCIEDTLLVRRTGRLGVGEIISLIAVSSPNSEDAFAASRLGISLFKKMQTIVKHEVCG